MIVAMYPGRFDPVTNGHVDIVRRAADLFDAVVVSVAASESSLFSTEERVAMFASAVADIEHVRVRSHTGLTVEAAREEGARVLVRGLRAVTDFTAEFDMALMNREMAPGLESVYLMTAVQHLFISASRIRELAAFGRDVSEHVPPSVATALLRRFGRAAAPSGS
ncbi:MAG: pantetheine-phosphate adenylyltransferase [Chloroflexi bacterium]|nr:pantetheine-phosphate adenylyltransferase [Chloroflexota bacterium]